MKVGGSMVCRLYHNYNSFNYGFVEEEDAVKLARDDDPFALEYLMCKYSNFIIYKTKSYFIIGADREDLVQEGMIGLYKAIMAYDSDKAISFRNFACLCITRQIISAIKSAARQKHIPLNSYVSLYKPIHGDDNDRMLQDVISSEEDLDPLYIYISSEELKEIESQINENLSELELTIFIPYVLGKTYKEIAIETETTEKCIDNALQRIRKKLGNSFVVE